MDNVIVIHPLENVIWLPCQQFRPSAGGWGYVGLSSVHSDVPQDVPQDVPDTGPSDNE